MQAMVSALGGVGEAAAVAARRGWTWCVRTSYKDAGTPPQMLSICVGYIWTGYPPSWNASYAFVIIADGEMVRRWIQLMSTAQCWKNDANVVTYAGWNRLPFMSWYIFTLRTRRLCSSITSRHVTVCLSSCAAGCGRTRLFLSIDHFDRHSLPIILQITCLRVPTLQGR